MDKNGVIEFRCKKCGRHFWDYLIQNDDNLVVVQAVCMKCDRCKRTLVLKKYTDNTISITDAFTKELEQCTDLEKQQLMEMLKILRMKPVAV